MQGPAITTLSDSGMVRDEARTESGRAGRRSGREVAMRRNGFDMRRNDEIQGRTFP